MSSFRYRLALFAVFVATGADSVILQNLTSTDVIEGGNIKLECVSDTLPGNIWRTSSRPETAIVGKKNNVCLVIGFLNNSLLYEYYCGENGSTSVVLKNVSRNRHGEKWQCQAIDAVLTSNKITIYVKVPVESVQMLSQPNESRSIQENAEVNFKCNTSFCRPEPSVLWFLGQEDIIYNITASSAQTIYRRDDNFTSAQSVLTIRFNRTFNSWNIFCTAINVPLMNATSNLRLLNVTYAPDRSPHIVGYQDNGTYKVIESREGRLSCVIHGGNPLPYLTWDCYNSREVNAVRGSNTVTSNITWTAARDQRHCVCKSHYMSTITSVRVNVDVLFQARVTNFSANGLTSASTFIIKAGYRLSLHCIVEGNPVPQITFSIPDGMPKTVFGRTEMFHEVNYATYINAGMYSCTGRNNYTLEEPSKKDLVLIVKSLPRPYSEYANNSKVFASMHATITLQFRGYPYLDEIDRTNFTWYNKTSQLQSTDYKINIATNGLQSKLTIRNIMRTDFGDYKLHVLNSVGQFVQIYELLIKDIPDMPQNFTFIKRFTTESSVTLSWQPGFNGGSQQQFILQYKEESELDWIIIYVNDTDDPVMKFTINELNSYTDYHIKLLSVNVEGNSNETKILKFRTKGTYDTRETNPNTAGAVAGSTIGGTAMIAGSLVGVWFLRKRYIKKNNKCNDRTKSARSNNAASEMKTIADDETAYEKIKTDTDRRDVEGVENAYEQLKPDAERETSERKEKEYEELKADKDGFDSTIPVYINLTL